MEGRQFGQINHREFVGGLEVVLRSPESEVGRIVVSNSLWQSDDTRDDIGDYQQQAVDGIHDYASEHEVDLTQFDVELRNFTSIHNSSRPYMVSSHKGFLVMLV